MKLDKLIEEFSSGIIEDDYYRIGNIFYFLKAKRSFVKIHFSDAEYSGRVYRIDEDAISIVFPEFEDRPERRAVFTFEALNRFYYCQVLIQRAEKGTVRIQFPKELKHLIRRLYPRVTFDDLFMRFIIMYSPIFANKEEERSFENRFPYFYKEIQEDNPSLRVLYQLLMEEIKSITPEFDLKLHYKSPPLDLNRSQKKVFNDKENFLIEDVSKLESYIEPHAMDILQNYSNEYTDILNEEGKSTARKIFQDIQKEDLQNFLQSYFLSPITMFDSVIGYLRMETNIFDKFSISAKQASEIVRILEIFSYAITKIRIRNSHFDPSSIRTRVVNISMSGLLMEISDEFLFEYLKKNRRVKMHIPIYGEELEIYGEINRFFSSEGSYYMGVLFFKSRPGDITHLEQFLYENMHYQFF